MTDLLRCASPVWSCSSITFRYRGCLSVLSVSYLLLDCCSLSLVAYIVLFYCKNNLFEFCFLTHEDWQFCHPSLFCYCFSNCLASYLVGICIAGVEYQTYITTDFFHQTLYLNLIADISWIIFKLHVRLTDGFIACDIPASVLSLTSFFSLIHLPCCPTWLSWVCPIFTSSRNKFLFIQGEIERILRDIPHFISCVSCGLL